MRLEERFEFVSSVSTSRASLLRQPSARFCRPAWRRLQDLEWMLTSSYVNLAPLFHIAPSAARPLKPRPRACGLKISCVALFTKGSNLGINGST